MPRSHSPSRSRSSSPSRDRGDDCSCNGCKKPKCVEHVKVCKDKKCWRKVVKRKEWCEKRCRQVKCHKWEKKVHVEWIKKPYYKTEEYTVKKHKDEVHWKPYWTKKCFEYTKKGDKHDDDDHGHDDKHDDDDDDHGHDDKHDDHGRKRRGCGCGGH